MNILILSCGTRNKIVQYFKSTLCGRGNVVAADFSSLAPALYDADKHYLVPKMTDANYLESVYRICRDEQVSGVLSLIDPELSVLASHESDFLSIGVTVIGSSYDACERCLDKYRMYTWLRDHQFLCAKSYVDKFEFVPDVERGIIPFPVFIKPRKGSASISTTKADDIETVDFLFSREPDLIIQEYLHGQEIGADVYVDMISGKTVSIFAKKKLVMRAGETDKAVSFKEEELFKLIARFVEESGFRGQLDLDIFEIGGKYFISEVNPRFGGGYPHAYECGVDHMSMIINNLRGVENPPRIGFYDDGVYMMKYNEVCIRRD